MAFNEKIIGPAFLSFDTVYLWLVGQDYNLTLIISVSVILQYLEPVNFGQTNIKQDQIDIIQLPGNRAGPVTDNINVKTLIPQNHGIHFRKKVVVLYQVNQFF